MDSTWVQLLVGLLSVAPLFLGVALGGAVLAWTPLGDRQPRSSSPGRKG